MNTLESLAAAGSGYPDIINPALPEPLQAMGGGNFVARLISSLINIFLIVGVVVFIFMFIYGAITWISSGGDKVAVEEARKRVIYAVIGVAILFTTWAIITLIQNFFGINILNINLDILRITSTP